MPEKIVITYSEKGKIPGTEITYTTSGPVQIEVRAPKTDKEVRTADLEILGAFLR